MSLIGLSGGRAALNVGQDRTKTEEGQIGLSAGAGIHISYSALGHQNSRLSGLCSPGLG